MAVLDPQAVKAGTVVPKPGDFVDGFAYQGGDPKANGSYRPLLGNDYLSSIPASRANVVRSILATKQPMPQGTVLKDPYWQQIYRDVVTADPTLSDGSGGFDTKAFNTRRALMDDYARGKARAQINALRMGIHHASGMMDAYDNLGNWNGYEFVNRAKNDLMYGFSPKTRAAEGAINLNKDALAAETATIFTGKQPAVTEIEGYKKDYSPDAAPDASNAALGKFGTMAHDRLNTLQQQWHDVMGPTAKDYPMFDPETQKAWQKLTSRYDPETGQMKAPQSTTQPAANGWGNFRQHP